MVANETNQKDSKERIVTIKTLAVEENIDPICRSIIAFIQTYKVDTEGIRIALKEALRNACIFAYPNNPGEISICLSICDNKNLEIEVRDWGCGIEDINKAISPLFSTQKGGSGMGFTFMEAFAEEMTVKSTLGKGTVVTLNFKTF